MKRICEKDELFSTIALKEKVLIKIGTEMCGACQVTETNMEDIEGEFPDWSFIVIDADDVDDALDDYLFNVLGVVEIPRILKFRNGVPVTDRTGLQTKEDIREILK